jgi:DNA-binding IclR family transcriptional regulator
MRIDNGGKPRHGCFMSNSQSLSAPRSVVQSVDRALSILEILEREGWVGVTTVARELDVHKSTAFRLLATLEQRGIVEQHVETQKYRLGFTLVRLAGAVRAGLDLTRSARPICEWLSEQTGETVNIAVLEGGEVVNIDQVNLSSSVVSVDWLGRRTGLHVTSTGKVFLAFMPERLRNDVLRLGLARVTPNSITDERELREQLVLIRRRGWSATEQELELGLNAVAAPIKGADGSVLATVCVSGPMFRLTSERLTEVGPLTADAGRQISRRLGFMARPDEQVEQTG